MNIERTSITQWLECILMLGNTHKTAQAAKQSSELSTPINFN